MVGDAQFVFDLFRQSTSVGVVQPDVERCQPAQHGLADAAGGDHTDVHALEVIGVLDAVGDIPASVGDPFVGGDKIAHQRQDLHDGVLGHTDAVAVGDLGDGDPAGNRRVEIDVVRTDPGSEGQLQIGSFGDPLGGQICRPKRLGDNDISVGQFTFELRVRAVLVRRHHQLVVAVFEEFAQAERTGHAPQQLAGSEIDRRRARHGLATRVTVYHRDAVAGVHRRIARDRIGIQDEQYFGHDILLFMLRPSPDSKLVLGALGRLPDGVKPPLHCLDHQDGVGAENHGSPVDHHCPRFG